MASDGWMTFRLGDLIQIKHGFAFKGEHFSDGPTNDVLLTPGNFAIGGGFKNDKLKYYRGPVPEDFVLTTGDLIVTMTDLSKAADTLGFPAIVPKHPASDRYLHNQRLGLIKITRADELDARFLYYLMCTRPYRHHVLAGATGTTVKHTSPAKIRDYVAEIPSLPVQRRIADVLGKLDDKIELNRRMNRTLEKMAAAIFKSWFIDFDPVHAKAEGRYPNLPAEIADLFPDTFEDSELGPIPKGWGVGPLSALADLITKSVKPYGEPETVWDHYSIPAYDEGQQPKRELGKTIKSGKYAVPERCVLVSKLNPQFPRIWLPWVNDPSLAICSTEFMPFVPRREEWRTFVYEMMRSNPVQDSIKAHVSGSTGSRQRVKPKEIAAILVLTPREDVIDAFSAILTPLHERILATRRQNCCLANLRDALLPRLLSGELRFPGAEKPGGVVS